MSLAIVLVLLYAGMRVAEFKASMAARKAGEFPDEKFPTSCSTFALWLERRGLIDEVPYREVWFDDSWSGDMGDTLTAWEMEEPL